MTMLPDVVSDVVTEAAKNMGLTTIESFFYRAALEVGFPDHPHNRAAEEEAHSLYLIYVRKGYSHLPAWAKSYAHLRSRVKPTMFCQTPIRR